MCKHTFSPVNTWRASLTTAKCPRPSVLSRSYSPAIFPSWWRLSPAMSAGRWVGGAAFCRPPAFSWSLLHLRLRRLKVNKAWAGVSADCRLAGSLPEAALRSLRSVVENGFAGISAAALRVSSSTQIHLAAIWRWEWGKNRKIKDQHLHTHAKKIK